MHSATWKVSFFDVKITRNESENFCFRSIFPNRKALKTSKGITISSIDNARRIAKRTILDSSFCNNEKITIPQIPISIAIMFNIDIWMALILISFRFLNTLFPPFCLIVNVSWTPKGDYKNWCINFNIQTNIFQYTKEKQ